MEVSPAPLGAPGLLWAWCGASSWLFHPSGEGKPAVAAPRPGVAGSCSQWWLPLLTGGRRGASQRTSGSCLRDFGGDFFLWPGDTPWAAAASRAAFLGDLWGLQDVSQLQRQRGRAGRARAAGGARSLWRELYPEPRDLAHGSCPGCWQGGAFRAHGRRSKA